MNDQSSSAQFLARRLVDLFREFSNVEAIALAGSQTAGIVDRDSDIDLYVYTTSVIPLADRIAIVEKLGAARSDLNLQFWDLGDEWVDAKTGIEVDIIYWDTRWIQEQLDRVLLRHQASTGYSTCFWHTIRNSLILYDKQGWLHALKAKSEQAYPEELRQAIIAKNHPILRRVIPSYLHQIAKAIKRHDRVSINHRVAALLASYFDVLFALNRVPNPGEKRLLKIAAECCTQLPRDVASHVESVLHAADSADQNLIAQIEALVDGLDSLLREAGFDPETSLPMA